jgi:DNA replicative helicase MCM subunit Mcm2 (Cdc46/Mcm family)
MVTVRGVVAKSSEVTPVIEVASFICESCMTEILVRASSELEPPKECRSKKCLDNKNKGLIF